MARRWTEDEIQYLSDNMGYRNHSQLSERLGRSSWAIKLKQHRLGLRFMDNVYTRTILSEELGVSRKRIGYWQKKGWLNGKKTEWSWYYGQKPWMFKEEDVVTFLKAHCNLFPNNGIPNRYFRNIVQKSLDK